MARIIPERTVEAWTTAYLVRWFPTALLWAPTQADPVKWDAALGLPGRRYFVLEYKAVERVGLVAPFIPIPIRQLKDYVADNKRVGATVVWYLLPYWTEAVAPGVTMPAQAEFRTVRAGHPKGQPPAPPGPDALPPSRTEFALGRGCESFFYLATPEALMAAVNDDAGQASLKVADVPKVAEGVTLEHFVHAVSAGQLGVTWEQLRDAADRPEGQRPPRGPGPRLATAFAVPTTGSALRR